MINVSIHYPSRPNGHFDADYYLNVHMPMAIAKLGAAVRKARVEVGVSGAHPDQTPPYLASAHLTFDSIQAFYDAFLPHAADLQGDIPNYTDIEPVVQMSEVRLQVG